MSILCCGLYVIFVLVFYYFMLRFMLSLLNVYGIISHLYHYYVSTCIVVLYLYLFVIYWLVWFIEFTENSKREGSRQVRFCLITYFGMNKAILRVYLFTSMHVLNFVFWICVICFNNGIRTIVWFGVIILQFLEKEFCENFGSILDFPGIPNQSEL